MEVQVGLNEGWCGEDVVAQDEAERGARLIDGDVAGTRGTAVFLAEGEEPEGARAEVHFQLRGCLVGGPVIDQNDFEVETGLSLQMLKAKKESVGPIERGDDDADGCGIATKSLSCWRRPRPTAHLGSPVLMRTAGGFGALKWLARIRNPSTSRLVSIGDSLAEGPDVGHCAYEVRWYAAGVEQSLKMIKSIRDKQVYFTGFAPRVLLRSLRGLPTYIRDLRRYRDRNRLSSFQFSVRDAFPILTDMEAGAGIAGGHYFHQDLWAARRIFERRPERHVDIGSRVDGFVAHLLVFMPVTAIDIRPIESDIAGLTFVQDDATQLAEVPSNSIVSLSSLHVAEHFGLGRYTDPVDPEACFRFMSALERVLAPGGRLYFSVPVGRERVEFNAHRVFAPQTILNSFPALVLRSFSFVGDDGRLYEDRALSDLPESEMACGLFEFTKAMDESSVPGAVEQVTGD